MEQRRNYLEPRVIKLDMKQKAFKLIKHLG